MTSENPPLWVAVFPSSLGWMAAIGLDKTLWQLTFGHRSRRDAVARLDPGLARRARQGGGNPALAARLRAYASGSPDDFLDLPVHLGADLTPFRRRVLSCCRQIPLGTTVSYGQLAAQAGAPGAGRAVGNCMAANRIPLVIPCHRVIGSGGILRGYSGPGGLRMKRRLLDLEARMLAQGVV
jgi:methylated-DNA-[protein]-cysteine S-methyltransferase